MKIIDVHIHVGHRHEWTSLAKKVWMDTGPYAPKIFDKDENQLPQEYGDAIKDEGVFAGILIPEYSPETAGVMPFERAAEINAFHPELVPVAFLNPNYHRSPVESQPELVSLASQGLSHSQTLLNAFEEQLKMGARGLKIHPARARFTTT